MACWTSGGAVIWLYSDLPFSFSNFALYNFCNKRKECHGPATQKQSRIMRWLRSFCWIKVRRLYPADKLVDLLAVGSVTSLRQGSEWARLHFLLTGLFVFALEMEIKISKLHIYYKSHKKQYLDFTGWYLPLTPKCAQPWHGGFEECPGRACSGPLLFHTSLCTSPGGRHVKHSLLK